MEPFSETENDSDPGIHSKDDRLNHETDDSCPLLQIHHLPRLVELGERGCDLLGVWQSCFETIN